MHRQEILTQLELERRRIDRALDALREPAHTNGNLANIADGVTYYRSRIPDSERRRRRRPMSADAKRRISMAQRKRWARVHAKRRRAA
jgi:hypothetical protein